MSAEYSRWITDNSWQSECAEFADTMLRLREAGGVQITMSGKRETRSVRANAVAHVWCRDYGKHTGETGKQVFARWKYNTVLPIKEASDHEATAKRARFERAVLDHVPDYPHKVAASFDLVRSRFLTQSDFAEALNQLQSEAAVHGCVLIVKRDDDDLLLRQAEEMA